MSNPRDASLIKFQFPNMDYDQDGTADTDTAMYVCIHGGPTWSGFNRANKINTCVGPNATYDTWGNLIEEVNSGTIVKLGTLTVEVDWEPNQVSNGTEIGGKIFAASRLPGNYQFSIDIPKQGTETEGPKILATGNITTFTPMGEVLTEGNESRLSAQIVIALSGIAFIAATPAA